MKPGLADPPGEAPMWRQIRAAAQRFAERCPGWRGPCPAGATRPVPETPRQCWHHHTADRRRGGRPWRCWRCAHARIGENRRDGRHWTAKLDACPQGHPYDAANTILYRPPGRRKPSRYCRTCQRAKVDRARLARRERVEAASLAIARMLGEAPRSLYYWWHARAELRRLARKAGLPDPWPSPRPTGQPRRSAA